MTVILSNTLVYTFIAVGALLCILLMVFISKATALTDSIEKLIKKTAAQGTAPVALPVVPAVNTAAPAVCEPNLNGVDDETAAMIMAIVANELKTPIEKLNFISIKEING